MLKKAIFANTENVLDIPLLMNRLEMYKKKDYAVFISDRANLMMKSLCTGVQASFYDYDYVICLNPTEKETNDVMRNYSAKQNYYMMGLLQSPEKTDEIIRRMEMDPVWGIATLPSDYLTASNWEQYENWADYYKIVTKWLRRNNMKVPTDIDRPPVFAIGGCGIIRTKAIQGLDSLTVTMFGPFFMALILSLLCQHNGYLPQYVITREMLINNCFGYETYTSWIPDVLKVKQEYYKQLSEYNKQTADHYAQVEEQMNLLRDAMAEKQQEIAQLRQARDSLQAENAYLSETLKAKLLRFICAHRS